MKKIYLDYASTTPVDKEVEKAMRPYFSKYFGNPGSIHSFGQEAIKAIDFSREIIAKSIGANFREIVFTGSATEANNLVLRGVLKNFCFRVDCSLEPSVRGSSGRDRLHSRSAGPNVKLENVWHQARPAARASSEQPALNLFFQPRLIVSCIEHESILETARDLAASFKEASLAPMGREKDGVEVVYLPVSRDGFVDLKKLKEALNERTILVSVMYANNEIGTIQPISEIANLIRNFRNRKSEIRNSKSETNSNDKNSKFFEYPLFHTDAVQAFQYLDCDVNKLGVDFMTLSAHKIYGPKGIGALYIRNPSTGSGCINSMTTGGGQEFGLRSGTENVPAIVGFGRASELRNRYLVKESLRVGKLRNYLWENLKKVCPKIKLNGSMNNRLPNNLNVSLEGFKSQDILIKLDLRGVAVSSGSACASKICKPSYVLSALKLNPKYINSAIRFSLGRGTTKQEIDFTLGVLTKLSEVEPHSI